MYASQGHEPIYAIKAELFKALAHPVRIRILELLSEDAERSVADLLQVTELEASHLSQHLSVLRKYRVVTSHRTAKTVHYRIAHPSVVELLATARRFVLDNVAADRIVHEAAADLPRIGR